MKKLFTIFCLFAAVMLTTSCQKELPDAINKIDVNQGGQTEKPSNTTEPELKVSEPGLFGPKGGELSITVTATAAWVINKSSGSDWLTLRPESGTAGSTRVTLVATENTSRESRTATLTVQSGEITKKIEVSQSAKNPEFSLDTNNIEFASNSGSKSFTINSNTSWTVSSSQTWCSVSPTSGNGGGSVTVKVEENTSISERTAIITVKSEVGDFNVKVIQSGAAAVLSLDTNSLDFASGSGTKSFKITSNTSWKVSSDQTWCSVSPTSGSNDGSVTVRVDENTSITERTATITVKSETGDFVVKVTQSGAGATLSLDTNSLEFASGSASKTFKINSNTSWTVSSNNSWCSVSPTSGNNDGSVTVKVTENTSTNARTAIVTIESGTITKTLSVTQSGAAPPVLQDRSFTVGNVRFKMIAVEGGTFTMGATSEQGYDYESDERPTHTITLSSYSIGETEVTQALWEAVMGYNPSKFVGSSRPVEEVSWYDCQDFIRKLNSITGENFRLPTEAEWEFAARGGNKSRGYKYSGSNTIGNVAWYSNNNEGGTHNVGTKLSNELGIYDMSGNVWEWCSDWYGSYNSSAQTDPSGPGSGSNRVNRGGSGGSDAEYCRVSSRDSSSPTFYNGFLGVRLAL